MCLLTSNAPDQPRDCTRITCTHSLTHSRTHALTHSLTHSRTHSLTICLAPQNKRAVRALESGWDSGSAGLSIHGPKQVCGWGGGTSLGIVAIRVFMCVCMVAAAIGPPALARTTQGWASAWACGWFRGVLI